MTALGEKTLMGLLVETDSLEVLAREGLDPRVVPTAALRPVVGWSLAHYRSTGKAPTAGVLVAQFGDLISDHGLTWDDDPPEETIEWAIDDLKSSFVRNEAGTFARRLVTEITEAAPDERVDLLGRFSSELASLNMALQPRLNQVDLRMTGEDLLGEYEENANSQGQVKGMAFGLPQIDSYTRGIHDGELCVTAGGPKTGKSWWLDFVAYNEWSRGRVAGLFTLENSIPMTRLRLACIATNLSIEELQAGTLSDADLAMLKAWVNDVLMVSDTPFLIFSPTMVNRTPHAIVQAARAHGVEALIVDQLTFLDDAGNSRSRPEEIKNILHDLKELISTGRHQMPCLLAHQINREGVKAAEKSGWLSMYHMAEGSEVERTVDWAFGLYQSNENKMFSRMQFQTLATRRAVPKHFNLQWSIATGVVGVVNEIEMPRDTTPPPADPPSA